MDLDYFLYLCSLHCNTKIQFLSKFLADKLPAVQYKN
jgi:hypothetical protein